MCIRDRFYIRLFRPTHKNNINIRDQIVAGNWKINNDQSQTQTLLNALKNHKKPENVRVMVAPAFTQLSQCVTLLEEDMISVTAQNVNAAASGAYTG